MYPNPQAALPLPARPNIEQYKKLAKGLVKSCKSDDPEAIHTWATRWVKSLARLQREARSLLRDEKEINAAAGEIEKFARQQFSSGHGRNSQCALVTAQFVIARAHGFLSWPKFVKHLESLTRAGSAVLLFETAVRAIVTGNITALQHPLRQHPELIRARSTREHRATLLHYVSANGVEGYRQVSPKNIAEITKILLEAGAEVDAEAYVYGSGCTTLGLVATSAPPAIAGVQKDVIDVLLSHGARMDLPGCAGGKGGLLDACIENGQPGAAEYLASRAAPLQLDSAAGAGRLDVVKTFFDSSGDLKPSATKRQLQKGFLWACAFGREDVAFFLLEHGADPFDPLDSGATPLHWAAGSGRTALVKALLDRGAPLEEINAWGGTALGHAGYGFEHAARDIDFVPTFTMLLAAGAKIQGSWLDWIRKLKSRSAEEKARVLEVFRRYGATT